ncbi:MAG: type II/IV secretion system protein [Campylobacteraceae bacterium]
MKKVNFKLIPAFTMLELVFAIVIIGILAAILIPRMQTSRMQEAADQIVSHIRYTQHLAMQDDKFNPNNELWFREQWRIMFESNDNTNNEQAYSIFGDLDDDGFADIEEVARNPQDTNKILSGGSAGNIVFGVTNTITQDLNIGSRYGIAAIVFNGGCAAADGVIAFDYMGRPLVGNVNDDATPYPVGRLMTARCQIVLTNDAGEIRTIQIEPETGYASLI